MSKDNKPKNTERVTASGAAEVSLLPCPFCGSTALVYGYSMIDDFNYLITCECGCSLYGLSQKDTFAQWNKRVS